MDTAPPDLREPARSRTASPTRSGIRRRFGDFATLVEALDYAATGRTGLDFHSVRGERTARLGYAELRDRAVRFASVLAGLSLPRGARIGIVAETSPDFVVAFFAAQFAGLVPAPLPLPLAFGGRQTYVAHLRRMALAAQAAALLVPPSLRDWLAPVAAELELAAFGTLDELSEAGPAAAAPVLPPAPGPDDVAYLQFSSGSTRFPTGVVVRQRALMANVSAILSHGLQVRDGDRAVSWLPLYHDMGLVGFLLAPLCGQITVDLLATSDFARRPQLWLQLISDNRGTVSYSPSFGYELCVRREHAAGPAPLDLSCWRIAGVGGDMIRPSVLERFGAAFAGRGFDQHAFLASYGMAEATLAISFAPIGRGLIADALDLGALERDAVAAAPADPVAGIEGGTEIRIRRFARCGPVLPGHEAECRDADGRALPERRVGRLFVRGPSLMVGYDGQPEATASVLSADGWLDTGDLGYCVDGELVLTGRAKDLIIVNGRNVWPQDLEWTVEEAVPSIGSGRTAAFSVDGDGVEDPESLVVAVETRALPDEAAREALIAAIGDALRARHGIDGRVVLLPPRSLVFTSSGKLSRSAVRARYLANTLVPTPIPA